MNDRATPQERAALRLESDQRTFPEAEKIAEVAQLLMAAFVEKGFSRQESIFLIGNVLTKII